MQDRFSRIIIFLIIVLSIFHSGEALKCYTCVQNTNCKNKPFEEIKCSSEETVCTKFTIESKNDQADVIGRTCAFPGFCSSQVGYAKKCIECKTDLCNASAKNTVSTIIIITSGLITLLWTIQ